MRVAVLCQEEPVFLGPFLREVLRRRPEEVVCVIIAGRRSAGERRRSLRERLESLLVFWLILEPGGFFRSLGVRVRARVLGPRDPRSVEGCARALGITVRHLPAANAAAAAAALADLDADIVLNQSEILLDAKVLSLARRCFLNRHASLLPAHRGRLGSFWAHEDLEPRYGVTIHIVDEGIDTGEVVEQWEACDVDSRWPFPRVLRHLNERGPDLFWSAVDRLRRGERPHTQPPADGPARRFPTLPEARAYRSRLAERRARR